jgi:hypothetical protein
LKERLTGRITGQTEVGFPEATAVESVGSAVLDYPALHLVPMGRGPGSRETGDRRRLAPGGISALLEVAITNTRRQTESYCRNSGAHPTLGRRESDLGAPRIHGELQKLGFVVSERTVARYLQRVGRRGDPGKSWLTFLTNHQEVIAAFDFFTVPTLTFQVLYCFFSTDGGRFCTST